MNVLSDPRVAPRTLMAATLSAIATASVLSGDRLATVAYETDNGMTAAARANSCRVLAAPDKLELGAYYLQPTQGNQGVLLSEGTYLCDTWGNTGRIDRGGYLQFIKTGDPTAINKTLMTRIDDEANPDHNPKQRIMRDVSRQVYQPPAAQPAQPATANLFSPP